MNARILLADEPNKNERRIEEALDRFRADYVKSGIHTHLNPDSFASLSTIFDGIDPEFRREWHKALLEQMPWLDREFPIAGAGQPERSRSTRSPE